MEVDLDALSLLVAEGVMGWERTDAGDWLTTINHTRGTRDVRLNRFRPFDPARDKAAAWEVVERLAELGWVISVCWGMSNHVGEVCASVAATRNGSGRDFFDHPIAGETMPKAVCCAACEILGIKVPMVVA